MLVAKGAVIFDDSFLVTRLPALFHPPRPAPLGRGLGLPRWARVLVWCLAGGLASVAIVGAAELRALSAVTALTPEQAARGEAVVVRGTVTFVEPGLVFFQDESTGTYFRPTHEGVLAPGAEVEVTGRTAPGGYVPGLEAATATVLRSGPLPPVIDATYEDLASGRLHYRRVGIAGVVRALSALSESRSLLRVAVGSRVVDVWVEAPLGDQRTLVDARIRVRGVAVGAINNRRQLVQPYVRALDWSDVEVLQSGVPEGSVPPTVATEILTYGGANLPGGRVRVAGTVMAYFGRGMMYLRTEKQALGVRLAEAEPMQIGDRVEVLGFPEMGRFTASLVDAKLVDRRPGPLPEPVRVRIEDLFQGAYDGDLIEVTALVTDTYRAERERIVVLQEKERRVRVALLDRAAVMPVVGSRVQVTGISRVSVTEGVGYSSQPESISVYARTADDLRVLERPSGWTVQRLALISSILGGAIFLALLWIALLRRQVRRQAEAARRQIEAEAALEERNRLARDFHDTLEQELVGLGLRLDAITTRDLDDKRRTLVEASRDLVSRIQAETRNLVGDLRDPRGRFDDLGLAFEDLLELNATEGGPAIILERPRDRTLLPAVVVHNLRMIARESVTNALKHARASRIEVKFSAEAGMLTMVIADDGHGFDVTRELHGKTGHYGCVGIRERCRKMGATVNWASASQGTTVVVRLPLAAGASSGASPISEPRATDVTEMSGRGGRT